jgi:DNA-binding transcriptional LysR family regulator
MDHFHLMSVYVAVAEEAGFSRAARRLGISPPAVTRAVHTLEHELGVKLLTRTTRQIRVTEAGSRYLEDARRILAEVAEAGEAAAGINAAPRGNLAVTAPALFGRMYVMPGIVDYLRRYPDMTVSALFVDRVVNLIDEGLDVGIRIGELPDSTMRAIRAGQVRRIVCAAPAYLKARGIPRRPADLARHVVIAASGVSPLAEWKFSGAGKPAVVRIQPRLTVTSNDAAIAAALAGFGVTRLLSYQITPHLAAGKLKIILDEFEPPPLPIHVLHREGRQASAKVRAFVDMIVGQIRADKTLR